MRRSKQEITTTAGIEEIITAAERLRLGINRDGAPYIVPMNFGYSNGIFYMHCAGEGLKTDLLKNDPRVCIEIDESSSLIKKDESAPCSWGVEYRSVIAVGTAEFIEDPEEKRGALEIILSQFGADAPPDMPEASIKATTVFRVPVETITAKTSS